MLRGLVTFGLVAAGTELGVNAGCGVVGRWVAVISVGADNTFGHPTEQVMSRLVDSVGAEAIYLTSEDGTVTFTTDGHHLWVETEQ